MLHATSSTIAPLVPSERLDIDQSRYRKLLNLFRLRPIFDVDKGGITDVVQCYCRFIYSRHEIDLFTLAIGYPIGAHDILPGPACKSSRTAAEYLF